MSSHIIQNNYSSTIKSRAPCCTAQPCKCFSQWVMLRESDRPFSARFHQQGLIPASSACRVTSQYSWSVAAVFYTIEVKSDITTRWINHVYYTLYPSDKKLQGYLLHHQLIGIFSWTGNQRWDWRAPYIWSAFSSTSEWEIPHQSISNYFWRSPGNNLWISTEIFLDNYLISPSAW